ncbi:uncharacterized protein AMSG_07739 [Thecamonas trahens ATCC 50062]|uniref:ADP,ATP carrier protein n=1 Tax=Thecamonas trahens ATCC 50062 TaxID=461836 RepID=A0A0L0DHU5_THETB|nr:hypothetical protein AMSG_07739 [Thecamonas trahens ATCC 50062]KNC51676.1 hypothetical protein AMSG_07739 [Thecamonas trahens ATCC 50062]|eukprot:XP_013755811.1 hypothetical protein AMSG_07739 [Thecamonas trahens ATCC 50062]
MAQAWAGYLTNAVVLIVMHPIVVVSIAQKANLSADERLLPAAKNECDADAGEPKLAESWVATAKEIFAARGIAGFYTAFGEALLGSFLYRSLYLGLYSTMRLDGFTAGVGIAVAPLSCLYHRKAAGAIFTVDQAAALPSRQSSTWALAVSAYHREGPLALWSGALITLLRPFAAFAAQSGAIAGLAVIGM